MSAAPARHPWWQRGVFYEVYPRSFLDSNGDGVGDLPGLASKLDYLVDLGVDAVWLAPIFPSPMADFGYDVADHCGVDPVFGTMADLDALLAAAHAKGLHVIVDYVPNHTSDRHPWFLESRASRSSPKRDWYVWRDPAPGGGPPTNWLSHFGGPAWTLDARTGQYYYHAFLSAQPDLNWRNPEVRRAMLDVLRFWLDRGVDGFRVDVIWHLVKDDAFRDNPANPDYAPGQGRHRELLPVYTTDRPEVHDVIATMRRVVDEYDDRVLIGEIYLPVERVVTYYGAKEGSGVHLPFNFQLLETPWDARAIDRRIRAYERLLPAYGWSTWVLGNHDTRRIASRVGRPQARVAAMLLLTLRGTPTVYYGDEIGMLDVPIPPDRVRDPLERNLPGLGLGRDPERTPMQWGASPNAGFTAGTPWLPVAEDFRTTNVAVQRDDPRSLLTLYRRLIELRRAEPALAVGRYEPIDAAGDLLAYVREGEGRRFLVVLNLGPRPATFDLAARHLAGRVRMTTQLDREGERPGDGLDLGADEGVVLELT
ncbi:MAG TPA: alpha-amylase family glycosyl hydrolase [Thermodesulfobacteriota bacterium]